MIILSLFQLLFLRLSLHAHVVLPVLGHGTAHALRAPPDAVVVGGRTEGESFQGSNSYDLWTPGEIGAW